ncbi:MAG: ABC transporter ATP-binding protein [Actinobacteria bacterium]|jgi:ABC-2 type transport system ATP-binding protein|nr:ABC transporter ATP-binding protein [Actinomycetota bacterium]
MASPVEVEGLSKYYRLYDERHQTLKSAVLHGRRARYRDLWALQDVSFEVEAGSTFGVIGPNGSGKSTLLRCLARIMEPDKGQVRMHGRVAALLELGTGFHPELSGRENVYLNASILGLSTKQIRSRFDEIVAFAGVEEFINAPIKSYSTGMYVRLGFAVAINVDPEILLIDEVLAVGDEDFHRKCDEKILGLRNSGASIVIVSHGLQSIRMLCEEALWLQEGRVRARGEASDVVDKYLASVHHAQPSSGESETRWGSGDAEIDRVEILGPAGSPASEISTGDEVTFRLYYNCHEMISRPVFGMAIHRVDGVEVTGVNGRDAGLVPERIEGNGWLDLTVPDLPLLPGTYYLSTSLYDSSLQHPFDHRERMIRFEVVPGRRDATSGVVSLGVRWRFSQARV